MEVVEGPSYDTGVELEKTPMKTRRRKLELEAVSKELEVLRPVHLDGIADVLLAVVKQQDRSDKFGCRSSMRMEAV